MTCRPHPCPGSANCISALPSPFSSPPSPLCHPTLLGTLLLPRSHSLLGLPAIPTMHPALSCLGHHSGACSPGKPSRVPLDQPYLHGSLAPMKKIAVKKMWEPLVWHGGLGLQLWSLARRAGNELGFLSEGCKSGLQIRPSVYQPSKCSHGWRTFKYPQRPSYPIPLSYSCRTVVNSGRGWSRGRAWHQGDTWGTQWLFSS